MIRSFSKKRLRVRSIFFASSLNVTLGGWFKCNLSIPLQFKKLTRGNIPIDSYHLSHSPRRHEFFYYRFGSENKGKAVKVTSSPAKRVIGRRPS
jgi:hypothetical protein